MVTIGRPSQNSWSISDILKNVDNLRVMRRTPGWDSIARTICIEALLAAENGSATANPNDGRLKTIQFIDYTSRVLTQKLVPQNDGP